jgi:hypothetical protein
VGSTVPGSGREVTPLPPTPFLIAATAAALAAIRTGSLAKPHETLPSEAGLRALILFAPFDACPSLPPD